MSPSAHDLHTLRILDRVAQGGPLSQRALSRELGIALGLTNLLLKQLIERRWVRVERQNANQVRYVLTSAGGAQRVRLTRASFRIAVHSYREARERVEECLSSLRTESETGSCSVVFYGVSEIAEVGWVGTQRLPIRLVGVVDDEKAGHDFMGLRILPASALSSGRCDGVPYDWLIVTTLENESVHRKRLHAAGVDATRVVWL